MEDSNLRTPCLRRICLAAASMEHSASGEIRTPMGLRPAAFRAAAVFRSATLARSHRWNSNPRPPVYRTGALVLISSYGDWVPTTGIEPAGGISPSGSGPDVSSLAAPRRHICYYGVGNCITVARPVPTMYRQRAFVLESRVRGSDPLPEFEGLRSYPWTNTRKKTPAGASHPTLPHLRMDQCPAYGLALRHVHDACHQWSAGPLTVAQPIR
jgi:hypothetical protein